MRITLVTASASETEGLGEGLGVRLPAGAVVTLTGELGAGKTALIRGICRGAGCRTRASSPTYALMHLYEGPVPVCHFDLWRVEPDDPFVALEVEELMDGRHIVLIEWPGPVEAILPASRLAVSIEPEEGEARRFGLEGPDAPWRQLLEGWIP